MPVPTNADSITRNAGATWFVPTENEWYKAAYYNGATSSYFDYPTATDTAPNNNLPTADTGNSANFLAAMPTTGDLSYPMTAVRRLHNVRQRLRNVRSRRECRGVE